MKSTLYTQLAKELLGGTDISSLIDYHSLEKLPGGVVSLVLATTTKEPLAPGESRQIVLKHTLEYREDAPLGNDFSFPDRLSLLKPAPLTHHVDYRILDLLQGANGVRVPTVLRYYEDRRTTVMVDFRSQGYQLMQQLLVDGAVPPESARNMGRALADLVQIFGEMRSVIPVVEDSSLQCRERLDELHMFLRPQLPLYREIENKLLSGKHVVPTDTHPKNIAANATGEVLIFDFGRSIVADEQFPAPNFAAHIALAALGGCFDDSSDAIRYIEDFVGAYNQTASASYRIDDLWFVRYFAAELLHRGLSGRWLDKRLFAKASLQEIERAVHDFGIEVFRPESEDPIASIEKLLSLVHAIAQSVRHDLYKGRRTAALP